MDVLNPLTPLFNGITKTRLKLYQDNWIAKVKLPIPVVSIGNITMGGTGKTPFTIWLLQYLIQQKKIKVGVVVRSYKAQLKKPTRVEIDLAAPEIFGDEAVYIQKQVPDAIVYSGPKKYLTAQALYENEKPDLILVDDGFQHLKLHRDLDIVLCDTSVAWRDYAWPPWGRARESIGALARAAVVVFTKQEMANSETLQKLKNQWEALPKGLSNRVLLNSKQVPGALQFVGGKQLTSLASGSDSLASHSSSLSFDSLRNLKVFAFAGLANPLNFNKTIESMGISVTHFIALNDHTRYSLDLIQDLIAKSQGYDICVTTEKDAIKLREWPYDGISLFTVPLSLEVSGELENFYAKINQLLR